MHRAFPSIAPLLAGICAAAFLAACEKKTEKEAPAPPQVLVSEVSVEDVPVIREWIGSISGAQNSQIEARVSGYLMSQDYIEGSMVKGGDVLFQIDPRPYQASLAQAEATLAEAQAKAELAQITLDRQTELFKTTVISAQEFDVATQTAQADIAGVQAAEAAKENAKLNLEFCTIIAPFDGIVGKAQAQIGDLVGPGAGSVLTTISQIQPIKVNFFLSEQEYLKVAGRIARAEHQPIEERPRDFQISLSDGEKYPHSGVFDFLNRQVDPRTGTIEVVALFSNPDFVLRPGQYAKVYVHATTLQGAVVVPQRAVSELQGTYYQIAVVGKDNVVEVRSVVPGIRTGSNWVITSGLQPGESIVVEGGQKLRNGMTVDPKTYVPPATPTPTPMATPEPIPTPGPTVEPAAIDPTPAPPAEKS